MRTDAEFERACALAQRLSEKIASGKFPARVTGIQQHDVIIHAEGARTQDWDDFCITHDGHICSLSARWAPECPAMQNVTVGHRRVEFVPRAATALVARTIAAT